MTEFEKCVGIALNLKDFVCCLRRGSSLLIFLLLTNQLSYDVFGCLSAGNVFQTVKFSAESDEIYATEPWKFLFLLIYTPPQSSFSRIARSSHGVLYSYLSIRTSVLTGTVTLSLSPYPCLGLVLCFLVPTPNFL